MPPTRRTTRSSTQAQVQDQSAPVSRPKAGRRKKGQSDATKPSSQAPEGKNAQESAQASSPIELKRKGRPPKKGRLHATEEPEQGRQQKENEVEDRGLSAVDEGHGLGECADETDAVNLQVGLVDNVPEDVKESYDEGMEVDEAQSVCEHEDPIDTNEMAVDGMVLSHAMPEWCLVSDDERFRRLYTEMFIRVDKTAKLQGKSHEAVIRDKNGKFRARLVKEMAITDELFERLQFTWLMALKNTGNTSWESCIWQCPASERRVIEDAAMSMFEQYVDPAAYED